MPTEATVSSSPRYSTLRGNFKSISVRLGVDSDRDNSWFKAADKRPRRRCAPGEPIHIQLDTQQLDLARLRLGQGDA